MPPVRAIVDAELRDGGVEMLADGVRAVVVALHQHLPAACLAERRLLEAVERTLVAPLPDATIARELARLALHYAAHARGGAR